MMKNRFTAVLMITLLHTAAIAQQKGPIELTSVAEVEITVKNEKGEQEVKRVDAAKANVAPGDPVIFTTYYANNGKEPASNIVINNPVPQHMVYLEGTAEGNGSRIDFSVDQGKTFGQPGTLRIKNASGKERPARPEDYTNVKWTLLKPLSAGAKGSVSFRAKVK